MYYICCMAKSVGFSMSEEDYDDLSTLSLLVGPGSISGCVKYLIKQEVEARREDIITFRKMVRKPLVEPEIKPFVPPPVVVAPKDTEGLEHIFPDK